jgi:putative acetyltransferase
MSADPSADIIIRPQLDSDLAAISAIRNASRARWGTLATPYESVERWRKFRATTGTGQTELVACANGEAIGMAGLFRRTQARRAHVAEFGITIRDDWQGKGVGTKLLAALTDLADHWLGLRRLELSVYTDNAPAIALYRKFGFVVEATETADAFREGAYANAYVMGRLNGDLPRDFAPYPSPPPRAERTTFTLRAAEPDDAEAITEIMRQPLVRHGTLRVPFTTVEENAPLAAPTDDTAKTIVAEIGGKPVGITCLIPGKARRRHVGEIAPLAVHDTWHGQGIGGALLGAALDIADHWLNLRRVQLGVLADNQPAIALYRKAGFLPEGCKRAEVFRAGAYADTLLMARFKNL